jgi:hypothetical protein
MNICLHREQQQPASSRAERQAANQRARLEGGKIREESRRGRRKEEKKWVHRREGGVRVWQLSESRQEVRCCGQQHVQAGKGQRPVEVVGVRFKPSFPHSCTVGKIQAFLPFLYCE